MMDLSNLDAMDLSNLDAMDLSNLDAMDLSNLDAMDAHELRRLAKKANRMANNAQKLRELAKKANAMASDLESENDSYSIAIKNGIKDESYEMAGGDTIPSYSGECEFIMHGDERWKAIGHVAIGDGWTSYRPGFIEFIRVT